MATSLLFDVQFRIVKAAANPGQGQGGPAWAYRSEPRRATIVAASGHPKDILAVLNSDVTIPGGMAIEVIQVTSTHTPGTEGNTVLS